MVVRKKIPKKNIEKSRNVKVKVMGNLIDVFDQSRYNTSKKIQKIDKDHYVDLQTGEIKLFNHLSTRSEQIISLFRTFGKIRELVNTNCNVPQNCWWLTLTYSWVENPETGKKEPVRDIVKIRRDYQLFWQKFCQNRGNFCKKSGLEKPEYISVLEPQESGSWHFHVLVIWKNHVAPKVDENVKKTIEKLWGNGFIELKNLDGNVDNLGSYLSCYLSDVAVRSVDEKTGKESKKIIKNKRLDYYPIGVNIFRCSRGILQPLEDFLPFEDIKDEIDEYYKIYDKKVSFREGAAHWSVRKQTYKMRLQNSDKLFEYLEEYREKVTFRNKNPLIHGFNDELSLTESFFGSALSLKAEILVLREILDLVEEDLNDFLQYRDKKDCLSLQNLINQRIFYLQDFL